MKRWSLWIPLACFVALLALLAMQLSAPADRQVTSAMIGKPLPQFALPAATKGVESLASTNFRDGQPRLMNVFASWCVPCAAEAPQLAQLQAKGAVIVAVAVRDQPGDVGRFLDTYGNPFRAVGADPRSAVQLAIGSSGVPETFIVDGRGIIRYQHIGEIRAPDVPVLLRELEKVAG